MFGITSLYILVIILTYALYFKEPVIDCAKRLMFGQVIALLFQVVLNYFNYHSQNKIVVLATLFVSAMIFSGVLSSFFQLELLCKYLGY